MSFTQTLSYSISLEYKRNQVKDQSFHKSESGLKTERTFKTRTWRRQITGLHEPCAYSLKLSKTANFLFFKLRHYGEGVEG